MTSPAADCGVTAGCGACPLGRAGVCGDPGTSTPVVTLSGCAWCGGEPGQPHRRAGCLGVPEGEALCAAGIHEADGSCGHDPADLDPAEPRPADAGCCGGGCGG